MVNGRDGAVRDKGAVSMSQWARVQRELLRLERDEEVSEVADTINNLTAQECIERGVSLVPVAVMGLSTGLYGRACVSVGDPKGRPLPAHRLSAGDQVRLYSTKGSKGGKGDVEEGVSEISGVVGKVTETAVEVISEDADEVGSLRAPLRLDVVASEATHKKLMAGLDALEMYPGGGPAERVISVLFGYEPPSAIGAPHLAAAPAVAAGQVAAVSPALGKLNESQREAVSFALATRDVALIHGPPGTGKTTTVVSLIREAVARGWRCLVCAPSNVAVDGILEKLVAVEAGGESVGEGAHGGKNESNRPRVVRMGHPARLLPQVLEHSMEALLSRHEGTAIVKDVRKEIDSLLGQLHKPGGECGGGGRASKFHPRIRGAARKGALQEVKTLRKEARAREGKVVREVLRSRNVVLATCVGAATYSLREEEFDLVVIDEAAQALEAACWIPILKGRRLVLAGDHKQLAPTVMSREAEAGLLSKAEAVTAAPPRSPGTNGGRGGDGSGGGGSSADGLGLTMFDRVLRDLGHDVCRMLNVQYRMNRDICDWASGEMYGGLLLAHPSVAERRLTDLPHASAAASEEMDMWAAVMLLIDTTGCDMPEEDAGGGSRRNGREAEVAVLHVKGLLGAGILESEVAVISPYNGQVNLLKQLLRPDHPGVEVRSVDGFQGGEKEAIVLSLVRSNQGKKVGFLADARRLNVAVTRARRHVAIICDAECCGSDAFIGRLLRHIENRGEYRSALELEPASKGDFAEATMAAAGGRMVGSEARGGAGVAGRSGEARGVKEVLSDEDVLRRVEEFARRESPDCGQEEEDEEDKLELPPELTARQRALVHESAEWLGLRHVSVGEGCLRFLVLSRPGGSGEGARGPGAGGQSPDTVVDENSNQNTPEGGESFVSVLAAGGSEDDTDGGEDAGDDVSLQVQIEALVGGVVRGEGGAGAPNRAKGTAPTEPADSSSHSHPPVELPSKAKAPGGGAGGMVGPNPLLASLHAERAARRPPVPPPGGRKKGGNGNPASTGGGGGGGGARSSGGPDDRGFTIDFPSGGGGGGGANKTFSKKSASGSKKGKKKAGAGGGKADGGTTTTGGGVGKIKKCSDQGSREGSGTGCDDDDGDVDDDLAYLDAQIRKERRSEPCYASLLRATTEAMQQNNPRWAAAQDKGKPARSAITGARRAQLKGVLQTRLTDDEKKRSKSKKKA